MYTLQITLEKFGIIPLKVPKKNWSLEDFPDSLIQEL